jgi:hypothetical protein
MTAIEFAEALDKFRGRRHFFGLGILIELTPLHS